MMKERNIQFNLVEEFEAERIFRVEYSYYKLLEYSPLFPRYNGDREINKFVKLDFLQLYYIAKIDEKFSHITMLACLDIEQALKTLDIEDDVEVSCVLVDDERIHEINREYRHIDRSTDVISFAMEDNDQFYVEGMPRTLGDIFISVDHAKKQAEEYGHSLRREMCFLFTHGILHLLGYDHMTDEQEKEMFGLQDKILGALNIEREGV